MGAGRFDHHRLAAVTGQHRRDASMRTPSRASRQPDLSPVHRALRYSSRTGCLTRIHDASTSFVPPACNDVVHDVLHNVRRGGNSGQRSTIASRCAIWIASPTPTRSSSVTITAPAPDDRIADHHERASGAGIGERQSLGPLLRRNAEALPAARRGAKEVSRVADPIAPHLASRRPVRSRPVGPSRARSGCPGAPRRSARLHRAPTRYRRCRIEPTPRDRSPS